MKTDKKNNQEKIYLFSDGASKGNPGAGGYGAIIIVNDYVKEVGGYEENTTNNRMEMMAFIEGVKETFEIIKNIYTTSSEIKFKEILVHSDSTYLIEGVNSWRHAWARNGWKTKTNENVSNIDLWQEISDLIDEKAKSFDIKIIMNKVLGHSGLLGNERCDEIASLFANKRGDVNNSDLYDGSLSSYEIDVFETFSVKYVCYVDGSIEEYDEWSDCKERIAGVTGARYKKVKTKREYNDFRKSLVSQE